MHVVVAGASGGLGRAIAAHSERAGHTVRGLSRADFVDDDALARAVTGGDAIVSALGAPVSLTWGPRAGYMETDVPLHARLVAAAKRADVRRFVYVSVFGEGAVERTVYVRAHRVVEEQLRASGLASVVVRPTGFMSAFLPFLDMAARGLAFLPGDGRAESNPIATDDLAQVCVDGLAGDPRTVPCGGPLVHSRRGVIEEAFSVVGKRPRILSTPLAMLRLNALLLGPVNPRLRDLLRFVCAISSQDLVAPKLGTTTMREVFERARHAQ